VVALPSCTGGKVDLLEECKLADESLRLLVRSLPVAETLNPSGEKLELAVDDAGETIGMSPMVLASCCGEPESCLTCAG
jgi:hypothetical protein